MPRAIVCVHQRSHVFLPILRVMFLECSQHTNQRSVKPFTLPIAHWMVWRSSALGDVQQITQFLKVLYEMNSILCVLLVYNDNGSVQTLCITRVSALCTKCLHRPIVIINQQCTKGEIHFIYLHYFHVFGVCFINRYHVNGCVSLENPTVGTANGRA